MSTTARKTPGVKRPIARALARVNAEITGNSRGRGHIAGGLSGEGYAGGYRDALNDVQLLLNGMVPQSRGYWMDTAQMP